MPHGTVKLGGKPNRLTGNTDSGFVGLCLPVALTKKQQDAGGAITSFQQSMREFFQGTVCLADWRLRTASFEGTAGVEEAGERQGMYKGTSPPPVSPLRAQEFMGCQDLT